MLTVEEKVDHILLDCNNGLNRLCWTIVAETLHEDSAKHYEKILRGVIGGFAVKSPTSSNLLSARMAVQTFRNAVEEVAEKNPRIAGFITVADIYDKLVVEMMSARRREDWKVNSAQAANALAA